VGEGKRNKTKQDGLPAKTGREGGREEEKPKRQRGWLNSLSHSSHPSFYTHIFSILQPPSHCIPPNTPLAEPYNVKLHYWLPQTAQAHKNCGPLLSVSPSLGVFFFLSLRTHHHHAPPSFPFPFHSTAPTSEEAAHGGSTRVPAPQPHLPPSTNNTSFK
jgi:hypothetical protein